MCYHADHFNLATPTLEERLQEVATVREHHRQLTMAANREYATNARGGPAHRAYVEHRDMHHAAAVRLRAERNK